MNKIIFIMMLLSLTAEADEGLCEKITAVKKNNQQQLERFTLTQFSFDYAGAAVPDLAIIVHNVNLPAQVKQVTFGRGKAGYACYFKPLAILQGGEGENFWGWHLLWIEGGAQTGGLFYARIDGTAWVSSVPKILTELSPINPQFKLDGQNITVTWQQNETDFTANMQAVSQDEGRSWEISAIRP